MPTHSIRGSNPCYQAENLGGYHYPNRALRWLVHACPARGSTEATAPFRIFQRTVVRPGFEPGPSALKERRAIHLPHRTVAVTGVEPVSSRL